MIMKCHFTRGCSRVALTGAVISLAACSTRESPRTDTSAQDSLAKPASKTDSVGLIIERPTHRRSPDSVWADYLKSLPPARHQQDLLQISDARTWANFADDVFTRYAGTLGDSARIKQTVSEAEAELERAKTAVDSVEQDTAKLNTELRDSIAKLKEAQLREAQTRARIDGATAVVVRPKGTAVESQPQAPAKQPRSAAIEARVRDLGQLVAASNEALERLERIATRASARLTVTQGMFYDPPDLAPMANRPLRLPEGTVTVQYDRSANKVLGVAECQGTAPVIILAANPRYEMLAEAAVFMREHEFAHLALRHVDCRSSRPARSGSRQEELDADCYASRVLQQFHDGRMVVGFTTLHFKFWNAAADGTHPASVDRATALEKCPNTPPPPPA
jgi:hypothetical protein